MNTLSNWMQHATTPQLARLAKLANTTIGTLRNIGGNYRESNVTAELALKIDRAAAVMRSRDPDLPPIDRETLSTACQRCEFAKACRKLNLNKK